MSKIQTWINVLPKHIWTCFYSPAGAELEIFMLAGYSIENGAAQLEFKTKKIDSLFTGMSEVKLGSGLSARFYVPIELHQVPGIGLSPKLVYTFPRGCRIEEYKPEYASPEERLYQKARRHEILQLKG